jgi:hypothetical protein
MLITHILLPLLSYVEIILQLFINQLQIEEHEVRAECFEDGRFGLFAGFGRQEANGAVDFVAVFLGGGSF